MSEAWGRGRAGFVSTVGTEHSSLPGCALGGVPVLLWGVPLRDRQLSSFRGSCHRVIPPWLPAGLLHPWLCASLYGGRGTHGLVGQVTELVCRLESPRVCIHSSGGF